MQSAFGIYPQKNNLISSVSAPKAKALGFLLQRPNLRQHVYHWRRGSCLHRREFPLVSVAVLYFNNVYLDLSSSLIPPTILPPALTSLSQTNPQQGQTCTRIDKSFGTKVPQLLHFCVAIRLATYVKSAIHDRNLSLRGLQRYVIVVIMRRHLLDQFIFNCSNLFSEPASHPKAKALGFPGRNH